MSQVDKVVSWPGSSVLPCQSTLSGHRILCISRRTGQRPRMEDREARQYIVSVFVAAT